MNPRLLLITPIATHPQTDGAATRIFTLARLLQSAGCIVHVLLCAPQNPPPRHLAAMSECWDYSHFTPMAPAGQHLDDSSAAEVSERVLQLHQRWQFNAVICNYVWCSGALLALGGDVLKVLDTHHVFAGRHERLRAEGIPPQGFSTSIVEEMRGLARADIVLATNPADTSLFRARGHRDVRTLGHIVPRRARLVRNRVTTTAGLFINNCPATRAAFITLQRSLPRAPPALRLIVAGATADQTAIADPFRHVPNPNTSTAFFDQVDIALYPACIQPDSTQIVEAISQGMPLLATHAAMDDLPSDHPLHRMENVEELALCLSETRFGTTLRNELAAASRRAAAEYATRVRAATRGLLQSLT